MRRLFHNPSQKMQLWHRWLPTPGNIVFTLLLFMALFWAQSAGAWPAPAPAATVPFPTQLNYQGYLRDLSGNPLSGSYNMIFRLYDAPEGGTLLWQEDWIAPNNQVIVSEGLFNVALGRLNPIQASTLNQNALYVGISIDGDPEATPREQLTMVPYAWSATTVVDGAITTAKLADNVVSSAKIQDGQVGNADLANGAVSSIKIQNGQVTTADLADNAINTSKIAAGAITISDLANNAVDSTKIQNGQVTTADLADNAITTSKIASGAVTPSDLDRSYVNRSGDTVQGNLGVNGELRLNSSILAGGQIFLGTGNLGQSWLRIPGKDFDPSNPVNGYIYYNNAADCLRMYAKGSWRNLHCF